MTKRLLMISAMILSFAPPAFAADLGQKASLDQFNMSGVQCSKRQGKGQAAKADEDHRDQPASGDARSGNV